MLAYLNGRVSFIKENYLVIDVNNIGYKVFTPSSTFPQLPLHSQEIKLFTYLHVREDAMDLYGFIKEDELSIFELLISVSGIGPKVALGILSGIKPSDIALAIARSDSKTLITAPGIGNKLAQRIILELKDKVKSDYLEKLTIDKNFSNEIGHSSEAINALISLGYSLSEANSAVLKLDKQDLTVEDTIKEALKLMSK